MFLHLGRDVAVAEDSIVVVFDMDTATVSPITRKLLSEADKAHLTETPSLEIPKSFIVYKSNDGKISICFSQFSSASLLGRVGKESIR